MPTRRTFAGQRSVYLSNVTQVWLSLKSNTPVLYVTENGLFDIVVQSGNLEDRNKVVYKFARRHFRKKQVATILDAYVCQLVMVGMMSLKFVADQLTLSASSCTFGFLWFKRRLRARIASFAGTDFERIWSHISRLRAISSPPAGKSSEVALSDVAKSVTLNNCHVG